MSVIESNKLIAEFMQYPYFFSDSGVDSWRDDDVERWEIGIDCYYKADELLFNESWDWLMPVVERIYDSDEYYEYLQTYSTTFGGGVELTINITNVYDAVVEFIKWYNENK
jgi:hypothetical protein